MTIRSRFWFECDPPRGECSATSPERETQREAQDAAWEAGWHLDLGVIRESQCPEHIRALDRVDWGSTA
jgi:hypothetical protein